MYSPHANVLLELFSSNFCLFSIDLCKQDYEDSILNSLRIPQGSYPERLKTCDKLKAYNGSYAVYSLTAILYGGYSCFPFFDRIFRLWICANE